MSRRHRGIRCRSGGRQKSTARQRGLRRLPRDDGRCLLSHGHRLRQDPGSGGTRRIPISSFHRGRPPGVPLPSVTRSTELSSKDPLDAKSRQTPRRSESRAGCPARAAVPGPQPNSITLPRAPRRSTRRTGASVHRGHQTTPRRHGGAACVRKRVSSTARSPPTWRMRAQW